MSDLSSEDEEVDTIEDLLLLDVGDIEYADANEDDDTPSEAEEGGVRRYLRANGSGRELMMTKTGHICKSSCMGIFSRCRQKCMVSGGRAYCLNGHLPAKCKQCCQTGKVVPQPQLPYCPNFSMQSTGMGPCMATQTPIPGVNACPSGTVGQGWNGPCVVW